MVQADEFLRLSTVIVAPTSINQRPGSELSSTHHDRRHRTRVLVEQITVLDPQRLGAGAGRLTAAELHMVDDALALVLGL